MKTWTCARCNQTVAVNTKGDPRIKKGDKVQCPNCGDENTGK